MVGRYKETFSRIMVTSIIMILIGGWSNLAMPPSRFGDPAPSQTLVKKYLDPDPTRGAGNPCKEISKACP